MEKITIKKISGENILTVTDLVAIEEPLEIQLVYSTATGRIKKNISVTMRTPGQDEELAAGFLFTEGIITGRKAILDIKHAAGDGNRILVTLNENIFPSLNKTERNFYSTSSCGICGKASIDAIRTASPWMNTPDDMKINSNVLYSLTDSLRKQQLIFEHTGSIHGCGIFTFSGECIFSREDVGRHNALDKIIGAAFLNKTLPLNECILLLSGRISFELVQKAVMAGIKIVAAVGGPSSMAVDMAAEAGMTLIGFLRDKRFNIYSGAQRIVL